MTLISDVEPPKFDESLSKVFDMLFYKCTILFEDWGGEPELDFDNDYKFIAEWHYEMMDEALKFIKDISISPIKSNPLLRKHYMKSLRLIKTIAKDNLEDLLWEILKAKHRNQIKNKKTRIKWQEA